MKKFWILSLLSCSLLLSSGCKLWPFGDDPVQPGGRAAEATQLGTAVSAEDEAKRKADEAAAELERQNKKLLSELKSNVVFAREANQSNPIGNPKTVVEGELSIAEGRLSGVEADALELAAARARELLVEQGRTAEARTAYEKAAQKGEQQAKELEAARIETARANQERDDARAATLSAIQEYTKKMEENQVEFDKKLKAAQDKVAADQIRALNIAGAACLVLLGLGVGFGGPAGLKMTWPFGVIALMCFGLAQILGLWWFKWAILAAVLIVLAVVGWWVWNQFKLGTLKEKATEKATAFNSLLQQVIPVLDKAYENAEQSGRELLDKTVFEPLSKKMNREEKSLIHTLRANAIAGEANPEDNLKGS